jgi:hypothetical protein
MTRSAPLAGVLVVVSLLDADHHAALAGHR